MPKTRMIDHQEKPLADHIAAFIDHQEAKGIAGRFTVTPVAGLRRVGRRLRLSTGLPT